MENNINWQFVKSIDDLIGKLAYEDMLEEAKTIILRQKLCGKAI